MRRDLEYLVFLFVQWQSFPTAPVISTGKFRVPDTTTVDRVRLYRLKKWVGFMPRVYFRSGSIWRISSSLWPSWRSSGV